MTIDTEQLLRLTRPAHDLTPIIRRIRTHLDQNDGYVSISGGKDSLVALDLTLHAEPNVPVAFFDSGLEYPETLTYLDTLERHYNITIDRYPAQPGLLELLAADGSWHTDRPTTGGRGDARHLIIDAPAAAAHTDHGPGVIWGVRADESTKRTWLYRRALATETAACCHSPDCATRSPAERRQRHGGIIRRNNGTVAHGPIWNWTSTQVWQHIARHQLPVNPVYDTLRRLGATGRDLRLTYLLDADLAEAGHTAWLRRGWPSIWTQLVDVLPRLAETP